MNERDSEAVAYKLKSRGYQIVQKEEFADVVLLNTCSVREQAEQKAIGKAGHLSKRKKKNRKFVFGISCMAQNRGEELFDLLPDLDLVVGTQKFHRVPEYLDEISNNSNVSSNRIFDFGEEKHSQDKINEHIYNDQVKVTAFVSIMQGCNMMCPLHCS